MASKKLVIHRTPPPPTAKTYVVEVRMELEILGESVDRYLIPQTEEDQERKRKLDELVQPDR